MSAALAVTEDEHASLKAKLTGQKAQANEDESGLPSETEASELVGRLNHLDGAVREAAIIALGKLEVAVQRKHVAAVVGLLKVTKAHVRQAALAALAALDQSLSMEHLVLIVNSLADPAHQVTNPNLNPSPNPDHSPNPNPSPSPNPNPSPSPSPSPSPNPNQVSPPSSPRPSYSRWCVASSAAARCCACLPTPRPSRPHRSS